MKKKRYQEFLSKPTYFFRRKYSAVLLLLIITACTSVSFPHSNEAAAVKNDACVQMSIRWVNENSQTYDDEFMELFRELLFNNWPDTSVRRQLGCTTRPAFLEPIPCAGDECGKGTVRQAYYWNLIQQFAGGIVRVQFQRAPGVLTPDVDLKLALDVWAMNHPAALAPNRIPFGPRNHTQIGSDIIVPVDVEVFLGNIEFKGATIHNALRFGVDESGRSLGIDWARNSPMKGGPDFGEMIRAFLLARDESINPVLQVLLNSTEVYPGNLYELSDDGALLADQDLNYTHVGVLRNDGANSYVVDFLPDGQKVEKTRYSSAPPQLAATIFNQWMDDFFSDKKLPKDSGILRGLHPAVLETKSPTYFAIRYSKHIAIGFRKAKSGGNSESCVRETSSGQWEPTLENNPSNRSSCIELIYPETLYR